MLTDIITNYNDVILAWIVSNPNYSLFIVFLISFFESLAIVGLIVPGSVSLGIIGILIGADILPLYTTLVLSMLGAIIGDSVSFLIGKLYHDQLYYLWPFKKVPSLINKGERFFITHGRKSIMIGRFLGPIRPILPLVVGMLNMPYRKFFITDIIASIFWAPAYILPGFIIYTAGHQYYENVKTVIIISFSLLSVIWFLVWAIQHIYGKKWPHIKKKITRVFKKTLSILYKLMAHFSVKPFIISILFLILFFLTFLDIMFDLYISSLNDYIHQFFYKLPYKEYSQLVQTFSAISEIYLIILFYSFILLFLILKRHFELAMIWFVNGAIAGGFTTLLKKWLPIPRPPTTVLIDHFSFPSAHVSLTVGIFGLFCLYIRNQVKNALVYFTLFVIAIALSRLYLTVHWFSDILGGVFFGLFCLYFSKSFLTTKKLKHLNQKEFGLYGVIFAILVWLTLLMTP